MSSILVSLCIWVVVFLLTLPFGVETEPHPQEGHAWGHPKQPRLREKILVSLGVAALLSAVVVTLLWRYPPDVRFSPNDPLYQQV